MYIHSTKSIFWFYFCLHCILSNDLTFIINCSLMIGCCVEFTTRKGRLRNTMTQNHQCFLRKLNLRMRQSLRSRWTVRMILGIVINCTLTRQIRCHGFIPTQAVLSTWFHRMSRAIRKFKVSPSGMNLFWAQTQFQPLIFSWILWMMVKMTLLPLKFSIKWISFRVGKTCLCTCPSNFDLLFSLVIEIGHGHGVWKLKMTIWEDWGS